MVLWCVLPGVQNLSNSKVDKKVCFCNPRNPVSPFLEVTNLKGTKVVCIVSCLQKEWDEGFFFKITFLEYSSFLESGQETQSLLLPGALPKGYRLWFGWRPLGPSQPITIRCRFVNPESWTPPQSSWFSGFGVGPKNLLLFYFISLCQLACDPALLLLVCDHPLRTCVLKERISRT